MMARLPDAGAYVFTLDDNIRFLEESTRDGLKCLLDHPYLALFQTLHEKYGAKFQLNMYYSYQPGGFSLRDVPDCWRRELEENAHWLHFSFHARHNDPCFPYEYAAPEELLRDYDDVMAQLRRIAGKAATDATTTLHYVCATREGCAALRQRGVRGLIGMFYPKPGREALRYYLTEEQAALLRNKDLWQDPETGLSFARNDAVLNMLALDEIRPALERERKQFYHVMIHEQYFYPDYPGYQRDFAQKVEAPLVLFQERGLVSRFLEEIIV